MTEKISTAYRNAVYYLYALHTVKHLAGPLCLSPEPVTFFRHILTAPAQFRLKFIEKLIGLIEIIFKIGFAGLSKQRIRRALAHCQRSAQNHDQRNYIFQHIGK